MGVCLATSQRLRDRRRFLTQPIFLESEGKGTFCRRLQ